MNYTLFALKRLYYLAITVSFPHFYHIAYFSKSGRFSVRVGSLFVYYMGHTNLWEQNHIFSCGYNKNYDAIAISPSLFLYYYCCFTIQKTIGFANSSQIKSVII